MRVWAMLLLASVGCSRTTEPEGRGANEPSGQRSEVETAVTSPTQRKAEVTPELTRKAEELLRQNESAPIGTEIPFSLGGGRYIARVEEHDNPAGEPGRPPGKHKGVTVYIAP